MLSQCFYKLSVPNFSRIFNPIRMTLADTGFPYRKIFEHYCRKPHPVGAAEALVDFFFWKPRKTWIFCFFARQPTPPAQCAIFKVTPRSRQAEGKSGCKSLQCAGRWLAKKWFQIWIYYRSDLGNSQQPKAVKRLVKYENLDRNE